VTAPPGDNGRPVLLLDVGGVLLLPAAREAVEALAAWGARPPDTDDATLHYEAVYAFDHSGDIRAYRRAYAHGLGLRGAALDSVAATSALWRRPWSVPIPPAVVRLRWLVAEGGIDVVIVSDSDGTVARQLEDNNVCQVGAGPLATVLAVCDSAEVGASKPSPLIFEAARRALSGPRRIIGHVGDSVYCDVEGARRAGVVPIHVDPLDRCQQADHRHVTGLADLDVLA